MIHAPHGLLLRTSRNEKGARGQAAVLDDAALIVVRLLEIGPDRVVPVSAVRHWGGPLVRPPLDNFFRRLNSLRWNQQSKQAGEERYAQNAAA